MPKPLRMRSHRSSGGRVRSTGLISSSGARTISVGSGKGMGSALPGLMPGVRLVSPGFFVTRLRSGVLTDDRATGASPAFSLTTPVAAQPASSRPDSRIAARRRRESMRSGIAAKEPNPEC